MFMTSLGISLSPIAAILSLPLVLADATFPFRILDVALLSLCWPKGSVDNPKSKVVSVGIKGTALSGLCCVPDPGVSREAALFAALALAICSRRADEDFRAEGAGTSIESVVRAVLVEAFEAPEPAAPSQDVADDPRDAEETFLGVLAAGFLSGADIDGFLSPLSEGFDRTDRSAAVLDPNLGVGISWRGFSGLGVVSRAMPLILGDWVWALGLAGPRRVDLEGVFCRPTSKRSREGVPSMVGIGAFLSGLEAERKP